MTISKAYRLNKDKPFASKILSLVESSMAAVSISVNLSKVDVGSKYYVRGGGRNEENTCPQNLWRAVNKMGQ